MIDDEGADDTHTWQYRRANNILSNLLVLPSRDTFYSMYHGVPFDLIIYRISKNCIFEYLFLPVDLRSRRIRSI